MIQNRNLLWYTHDLGIIMEGDTYCIRHRELYLPEPLIPHACHLCQQEGKYGLYARNLTGW